MFMTDLNFSNIICKICGNEMELITIQKTHSFSLRLKMVVCENCVYEYFIPDPQIYNVIETSVKCPLKGLPILTIKQDNIVFYWTDLSCMSCKQYFNCNLMRFKEELK